MMQLLNVLCTMSKCKPEVQVLDRSLLLKQLDGVILVQALEVLSFN